LVATSVTHSESMTWALIGVRADITGCELALIFRTSLTFPDNLTYCFNLKVSLKVFLKKISCKQTGEPHGGR
jgi:hypothetical protein